MIINILYYIQINYIQINYIQINYIIVIPAGKKFTHT